MDIAHTDTLERVARVIAGLRLSANANGEERSAGEAVDHAWRSHLGDAAAILKALREPDADMAAVGDVDIWERMVRAALGESAEGPAGAFGSAKREVQRHSRPRLRITRPKLLTSSKGGIQT